MDYKHLAITVRSSSNTDGRDMEHFMNILRKRSRHSFKHNRERPCILNCLSISKDLLPGSFVLTLHLEPTEHVQILRGKTNMGHHRNAGIHDRPDRLCYLRASFKLNRFSTSL